MFVSLYGVLMVSQTCLVGPFRSYVPENEKNMMPFLLCFRLNEKINELYGKLNASWSILGCPGVSVAVLVCPGVSWGVLG